MIPIFPAPRDASRAPSPIERHDRSGVHLLALPPLSLYVHFPWCVKKCPYCDFNSHEHANGAASIPESAYLDALSADLESVLPQVWGRRVHSVFIGGGTPSLLSAAGLDRLLADVRARLTIEADAEITLEANPGTFEAEKFASFRASGVNRLSIGIQSFDDRFLHALGRIHDGDEARHAVEIAQRHFDNFNLDLMFGLPGQSADDAARDVETARAFAPPHLSLYQLTLEPNTFFAKYPPRLPDDDVLAAIECAVAAGVDAGGWSRYEVSAYARRGFESRHNLNYWNFGDYLGIGAGAHGKLSFPDRIVRQTRIRHPQRYLDFAARGAALFEEQVVQREALPFEFMLNALRLVDGFAIARFAQRTGLHASEIEPQLVEAERKGLVARDHMRVRATPLGLKFLNDLQTLFLAD